MILVSLFPFFFSWRNLPYDRVYRTYDVTPTRTVKTFSTPPTYGKGDIYPTRASKDASNMDSKSMGKFQASRKGSDSMGNAQRNRNTTNTMPWRANYMVSKKTQSRIIEAGSRSHEYLDTTDRAIQVLQTLLRDTPSYECNESNVVCALTLSAKIMSEEVQSSPPMNYARRESKKQSVSQKVKDGSTKLHDLLLETISIAYQLIQENRLSSRQLANVVWAIAKHHSTRQIGSSGPNHDSLPILPVVDFDIVDVSEDYHISEEDPMSKRVRREPLISKSERLHLYSTDNVKERQIIVANTVDEICKRLNTILLKDRIIPKDSYDEGRNTNHSLDIRKKNGREALNMVEIAMSVWAFAIFCPRDRPAGWDLPTRTTSMPTSQSKNSTFTANWITFEQRNELNQVSKRKISSTTASIKDTENITRNGLNADLIRVFFDAASEYIIHESKNDTLATMKWQDLVNILWSFAYSGQGVTLKSEGLIQAIAQEVTDRLEQQVTDNMHETPIPKSRDLAQIAWALGVLQCNNFRISTSLIQFMDALSKYLVSKCPSRSLFNDWKNADIVQIAVSLAHGRLDRNELLVAIYDEVLLSIDDLSWNNRRELSNGELTALLWAQARLYLMNGVFQSFSETATRTLVQRVCSPVTHSTKSSFPVQVDVHKLDSQEQANLAWSLVVLEQYSQSEAITLLKEIFRSSSLLYSDGSRFHVEHAHQLWQAYSILQRDCPKAVENVPLEFIEFLRLRWRKEKLRMKTSSDRHIALSKTLELMGVAHVNEHDEDIDVAIILKSNSQWTKNSMSLEDTSLDGHGFHKVAVEFDGPNHFVRPRNGLKLAPKECPRPLGHTVLKYRLLKYQGWFVIRVPYYEYDKIPFWASMEKQRYLQRLLKTEAKRYFSSRDFSNYKAITPNRLSRFD